MNVRFRLNGEDVAVDVPSTAVLLEVLRDHGTTGPKEGCGVGVCGVCTVLVDDRPVSSCLYLAPCVEGAQVWTAEGLVERFPRVAESLLENEALQCGICTPGQVAAICSLLVAGMPAEEEAVRDGLHGNLCRCTGYQTLVRAAMDVLAEPSGTPPGP